MEQNVKTCSGKPVLLCSGWEEIQFQYGGVISFGFGWLLGCFSFCWFFLFVCGFVEGGFGGFYVFRCFFLFFFLLLVCVWFDLVWFFLYCRTLLLSHIKLMPLDYVVTLYRKTNIGLLLQ